MNIVGLLLLVIHIICCVGVILIVLLQAGKGASLGASFGGGSSQTMFGAGSATFIGRITWVMAGAFMATSLLLTMISPWGDGAVGSKSAILQEEPITALPLGTPPESALPGSGPIGEHEFSGELGGELTPEVPQGVPMEPHAEGEAHPVHEAPTMPGPEQP